MKKYRLIKEYPGSPKLGTIKPRDTIISGITFFDRDKVPNRNWIENYPDFWEEVVEKDYEILQMKNSHDNFYSLFKNEELSSYEKENHTIHSVRRKSDGEVFTIGDKIQYIDKSILFEEGCPIESFEVHDDKIYINSHVACADSSNREINNWGHFKKPLFTTEDGVDIYKGDIAVPIDPKTFRIFASTSYNTGESTRFGNYLYFSTKEAAEEYILMNKPCLSINDITTNYKLPEDGYYDCNIKGLKELVKSKL